MFFYIAEIIRWYGRHAGLSRGARIMDQTASEGRLQCRMLKGKEVEIVCDDETIPVEYRLYSMVMRGVWSVAAFVFEGRDMTSYLWTQPSEEIADDLVLPPDLRIRVEEEDVVIEYPAGYRVQFRDIKISL